MAWKQYAQEGQSTAVGDDNQFEEFIQQVMDDQGDLTRVEIINDKHINTTENLLIVENYQEKSTLMKTVESNLHQNLIPSTLANCCWTLFSW